MGRVSEPAVYTGYVTSLVGQLRGQRIPMKYKDAQAMVAVGNAAWDDDETPLGKNLAAEIEKSTAEAAAAKAADDEYGKQAAKLDGEALVAGQARKMVLARVDDDAGTEVFLARPFPQIMLFARSLWNEPDAGNYFVGKTEGEEKVLFVTLSNATAKYRLLNMTPEIITMELVEADQPDVEIPADWQTKSHLTYIPLAKAIRRVTGSMKKDEAIAIIQEWTKDDRVSAAEREAPVQQGDPGTNKGEGPEGGNRLAGGDAEAAAQTEKDAKEFAGGND